MMKRFLSAMLASTMLFLCTVPAARAADDGSTLSVSGKRAKIVAKSAVYGFGGGLVVGLASQVFKKKAKNIFLFGSLGLYAGIILGIYVISTSSNPAPYQGPDTYEDFSLNKTMSPATFARVDAQLAKPELQLNLVDVKF